MPIFFKMKKYRFNSFIFASGMSCILMAFCTNANSYDPLTHGELTSTALSKSIIMTDVKFMSNIGLSDPSVQKLFIFEGIRPLPVQQVSLEEALRHGAKYEDGRAFAVFPHISFFHFYDPQNNFPNGRALTIGGVSSGSPSPDWILETRGKSFENQYYSYSKAQQQFFNALTSTQPEARLQAFSMVFQSLGHIVHHIQDMAQPQHVRNEAHLPVPGSATALFEDVSKTSLSPSFIQQLVATKNYPIPSANSTPAFKKATDYWYSSTSAYSGMAEFTSKNFVSTTTGYIYIKESGQWKIKPLSSEFPLPNGFNTIDGSLKYIAPAAINSTFNKRGGGTVSYSLNCIKGKVFDSFYNTGNSTDVIQACEHLSSRFSPSYRYFDWNFPEVWGVDLSILIPRAVSFSAGLINHFFRGQVNITSLGGGKWTLTNESPEVTSGTYTVLSENAAGIRSQVAQFPLSLAMGASSTITFNPPDDTVKVVVAFSGKLGDEDNMTHGRVVPYSKGDPVAVVLTNPSTIVGGNSVSLEASVTGKAPSGTVQFFINGVAKGGPITLDSLGKASINSGVLQQGTYSIYAIYAGDSQNKSKLAGPISLIVTAPPVLPVPSIITNGNGANLNISNGRQNYPVQISLSSKPAKNVTLSISVVAQYSNPIVYSPTSFVFTPENYSTPQNLWFQGPTSECLYAESYFKLSGIGVANTIDLRVVKLTSAAAIYNAPPCQRKY